jgi:pimeloyl-ACP methyl ester carboxylesterase
MLRRAMVRQMRGTMMTKGTNSGATGWTKGRWVLGGAALLAAGAAIGLGGRRQAAAPDVAEVPRVSDAQWAADRAFVEEALQPLDVGAWSTQVFDRGGGEPLLFIPIVTHVEVIYARQLREFMGDHRVITYRRNEGKDRAITIADRVEEVRQLLDRLGIDRVHLAARSEGAIVAAAFAYTYPSRCRSLVLITLGMTYQAPPVVQTEPLNFALDRVPFAERIVGEDFLRRGVVRYLAGPQQRLTEAQLMTVYEQIPEFVSMYKFSAVPLIRYHDLRGKAQHIPVPTLLITSDEDPRATEDDLTELAAALPDCRGAYTIPAGGRFVNYIQGDATNRLMRNFYAHVAADAARSGSSPGSTSRD